MVRRGVVFAQPVGAGGGLQPRGSGASRAEGGTTRCGCETRATSIRSFRDPLECMQKNRNVWGVFLKRVLSEVESVQGNE